MGKGYKNNVIISGFTIGSNNRGCDALSIGAIEFLKEKGHLRDDNNIIGVRFVRNFLKKENRGVQKYSVRYSECQCMYYEYNILTFEKILFEKFHIILPFTRFGRLIEKTSCVAAINGGDGFSDIYSEKSLDYFNLFSFIAIDKKIPLILLPQTIGPFHSYSSKKKAERVLCKAREIYVRDNKYVSELNKLGLKYEITKDLSSFMKPEKWNIDIKEGAIGLNISGLAYSNSYGNLHDQFNAYPELIDHIISHFQNMGKFVYLIPHSYNYLEAEKNNDDLEACSSAYERLDNKRNVFFVNQNMTAPQIKYIISKMSFFIGTRMHSNFAAIYTNVPVFGLSYSYKFNGAFDANRLDSNRQIATINNLKQNDIDNIIRKIDNFYRESEIKK